MRQASVWGQGYAGLAVRLSTDPFLGPISMFTSIDPATGTPGASFAELTAAEASLTADLAAGIVIATALPVAAVLPVARQLTARHTALVGARAYDVFHVAAALHLNATRFLSFDTRQLALARAAGLRTG